MTDAVAPPEEGIAPVEIVGMEFQDGDVLLIVDVARDLFPGGPLPVETAEPIVPVLNRWIVTFRMATAPIVGTLDMHPPQTVHFSDFGGPWPAHCLAGTPGSFPHPDLLLPQPDDPTVSDLTAAGQFTWGIKGFNPNDDGYSAFDAKTFIDGMGEVSMLEYLSLINCQRLFVGGLATDYCIKNSVLDALAAGISVVVILDGVAAVDKEEGAGDAALEEMRQGGAAFIVPEEDPSDADFGKYVQCVPEGIELSEAYPPTEADTDVEEADEAAQDAILAEGEDVDTGDVVNQDEAEGSIDDDDDETPTPAPKRKRAPRRKKAEAEVKVEAEVGS